MLKDEEGIMLKGKSPTSHLCLPHQPLFANTSFLIIFVPKSVADDIVLTGKDSSLFSNGGA